MKNEKNTIAACCEYGAHQYQCKSSYSDSDAQRNLEGRTHYADSDTLRYFKAKILRGIHSTNGLYYLIQESLPHPELGRVRRNVLFDVFGSVVGGRDVFHKTAKKADTEYSELRTRMDSEDSYMLIALTLVEKIVYDKTKLDAALTLLEGGALCQ